MPDELYGLQIDLCCISCGNVPTSDSPLYEMKNHHYICKPCLLKEEQRGKLLKGVDGADIILSNPLLTLIHTRLEPAGTDEAQSALPGNDIFSVLEISLDAKPEVALKAIKNKTLFWIRQPPSDERDRMREQLREWNDELGRDPQFLETQRQKLRSQTLVLPTNSTLSVHGNEVETIKDFVYACEQSAEGWRDGEMHLRTGELEEWVISLTQNRALAEEVATAANSTSSPFRALNSILYRLLSERPFRLYTKDQWQQSDSIESISTLKQLTALCDRCWNLIAHHAYDGEFLTWLEHSQGRQGLREWYVSSIADNANRGHAYRSLGLELLLEQAVPALQRPEITFTFDGTNGSYILSDWDNEISHQPIPVMLQNVTRGATIVSVTLATKPGDPDWITLAGPQPKLTHRIQQNGTQDDPHFLPPLYNRPGDQNPVTFNISLQHLKQMKYRQTYHGTLQVSKYIANHQPPDTAVYPLTLSTMEYRQGFRRHLWRWGLRGGWPGLIRNFLVGIAISLIFFLLIIAFVHVPAIESRDSLTTAFLTSVFAMKFIVTSFLGYKFFLTIGAVTGVIGSMIGWRKGHADYPTIKNREDYIKTGFWLSLLCLGGLLYLIWRYSSPDIYSQLSFAQIAGCVLTALLMFLSICVLGLTRSLVERVLRRHYGSLLKPQGSEE